MEAYTPLAFADDEEQRAEGLARRIVEILADPHHPSRPSLHLYQEAARKAFEWAAGDGEQPEAVA